MNPIAYHNALAAMIEAQKEALADYDRRLTAANERAEALEKTLAALQEAKPVAEAP